MAIIQQIVPTEDQDQAKLVVWMEKQGIKFFAIPNGGRRTFTEGIKFKRCGVRKGVPDLCLPFPSGPYHGAYIELKRIKGSQVSEEQKYWLIYLRSVGYFAEVAKGFDEAKELVLKYLSFTPQAA
jgi:hypothetical protein